MASKKLTRKCLFCGTTFEASEARVLRGAGKLCSVACAREATKRRVSIECETCGKQFELPQSRINDRGQGRFCSRACKRFVRESNAERFERFVIKSPDVDACWGWRGSTLNFGYGQVRDSTIGKQIAAHRMSYTLHVGEIPDGKCVLHSCDNPPCSNPRHLFLGSKKDNSVDMVSKDRSQRGEKHFNARLDVASVREMRRLFGASEASKRDLAKRFSVSRATINDVLAERTWKWCGVL